MPYPGPSSGSGFPPPPSSGSGFPPPPFSGSGFPPPAPPYGGPAYGPPPDKSPFGAPGYGAPYSPYGPPQSTNALAIASLVCSIAGVLTCISAPVGIVLGHIAKKQIRQTHEGGEGLATAGLWVGYILTIIGLIVGALYAALIIFAIAEGSSGSGTF
ncbi:DUF4190 domain-containing protein [Actinoplanes sichuanensis]|nr:DUF4190 domain-containing protein [Actinoplanes sichuanensis]